jgi:hypothetical protein
MNLLHDFNAEHINGRRCGHCGQRGHTQPHCRRARSDGHNLHLRIVNIMQQSHHNVTERVRLVLNNMTVNQLKILMQSLSILPNNPSLLSLENYRIFPRNTAKLKYKTDRITVMMWFYLNQPPNEVNRKLNINTSITMDTSNDFDCPICLNHLSFQEKIISNCNHEVCKVCISNYLDHFLTSTVNKKPSCSLCRCEITNISFTNPDYEKEIKNKYFN